MTRVKNQDDFIQKAKTIHGDYYDYSLVNYVKSSVKVKIVCPIHGVFEQTPNKHLAGQGCRQCGRNRTKLGRDEFIRRAREVHGDRYDYSLVDYQRRDVKVKIICRIHGVFEQTPHSHAVLKQHCPKCSALEGGLKRMGDNNPMKNEATRQKVVKTCLERYGTKTYAESAEGRKKLSDIVSSDEVQQKIRRTNMERYNVEFWTQSEEGKQVLRTLMNTPEIQESIKEGYIRNYGVDHYMKTDEGRDKARQYLSSEDRQKAIQKSFLEKYGYTNALEIPQVRQKIKATLLERYGVETIGSLPDVHKKANQTKRRNGTFNLSFPERTLYLLLCDVFGEYDVIKQYGCDERYPFQCDFYIISLDCFIELNATWTHGGHWFNSNDENDMRILKIWEEKSESKQSSYYKSAIYTWTVGDLVKRQTALDNHLNYVVFWDNDLTDAKRWLSQFQ